MKPILWDVDLGTMSVLNAEIRRVLGKGFQDSFYGIAVGRFAAGVWVRRKINS